MASYDYGKEEVVAWIKKRFPKGASCLDVGACNGKWFDLLGDYLVMDAVEVYEPYIIKHRLREKYRTVICADIADCVYNWYDIIIFGDVIEHMTVEKAQNVLKYARYRCGDMIIAVPFMLDQGVLDGNEYEVHVQNDLTPVEFDRRYPGYQMISRPIIGYAYYAKG